MKWIEWIEQAKWNTLNEMVWIDQDMIYKLEMNRLIHCNDGATGGLWYDIA